MRYDLHCPSLKAKVKNRVCKQCGIYYESIAALKRHRQDDCVSKKKVSKFYIWQEDLQEDQIFT